MKLTKISIFIASAAILAILPIWAESKVEPKPMFKTHASAYLTARHAQKNREWDKALQGWESVLIYDQKSAKLPGIRSKVAVTALAVGEYDRAANLAKQTLDQNRENLTVFDKMILSAYAIKSGDLKLSKQVLEDVQEASFKHLVIPTINNYLKKGEGKSDVENYAQAMKDLARLFLNEGREDSTLLFARLSHYLDPNGEGVLGLLGDTSFESGDYKKAYEFYSRLNNTSTEDNIRIQLLAARSLRQLDEEKQAINLLESLAQKTQNRDVRYELGDYYRAMKDYKNAIDSYSRVLNSFDETIPDKYRYVHYLRAIAYEALGQWQKAEADLKIAIEYFPDDPGILNYLGYGWIDRNKNLEEAERLIRKALVARPDDGFITDSLGWALYKKGEYAKAAEVLEKAVHLEPYDPIINDHLGDAYWKIGRENEAKFQWRRAKNHYDSANTDSGVLDINVVKDKLVNGLKNQINNRTN